MGPEGKRSIGREARTSPAIACGIGSDREALRFSSAAGLAGCETTRQAASSMSRGCMGSRASGGRPIDRPGGAPGNIDDQRIRTGAEGADLNLNDPGEPELLATPAEKGGRSLAGTFHACIQRER